MNVYSKFITEVRSYSHILDKPMFAVLMSEESLVRVLDIKEDRFKVEVRMTEEMKEVNKDYFGYGFLVSSNFLIICGSLLREAEEDFRREYLKGIIHLNAGFGDLVFHREAFANFYRAFEYFVTARVLKKTKLANEGKELNEGMALMGLTDQFCEAFDI